MQLSGMARRPFHKAALLLQLMAAALAVACLPVHAAQKASEAFSVEDAPKDGCIYIRHLYQVWNETNDDYYASRCLADWGQSYVNMTDRTLPAFDGSPSPYKEVMCSLCGLKDHKLIR